MPSPSPYRCILEWSPPILIINIIIQVPLSIIQAWRYEMIDDQNTLIGSNLSICPKLSYISLLSSTYQEEVPAD